VLGPLTQVRRRRDEEGADLAVESRVGADETAVGRCDDARVLAAAGPFPGLPLVVARRQHRLGLEVEVAAVGAGRQADARDAGVAADIVLGPHQQADAILVDHGRRIEHVLGRPGHAPAGNRAVEADRRQALQDAFRP
jgi:hypothetical protein